VTKRKVKELMIELAGYATVSQEATLYEAVMALEEAQERFAKEKYKHRAILALDAKGRVVGKLSQWDVIRALEPGYKEFGDIKHAAGLGFSPQFIRSLIEKSGLWQKPLDDICRKASEIKVRDAMYTPTAGEYVEEEATLDQAIHQLIMHHHQSLLVTRQGEVVGILRLSDVFMELCRTIKRECSL